MIKKMQEIANISLHLKIIRAPVYDCADLASCLLIWLSVKSAVVCGRPLTSFRLQFSPVPSLHGQVSFMP